MAVAAADGFLTLIASQQAVRVAQASVDRARVLANTIDVLVKNELRPGADASRAKAELAAAETQLIQAQQGEQISRVTLAQLLGIAVTSVTIKEGSLLRMLPSIETMPTSVSTHPLANFQAAAVDVVKARQRALKRAYFPKFDFQAAAFGRGSGAQTNGETLGGLNGLAPNTFNWAVGFTAKFQLFDFSSIRSRKEIEKHLATAESARFDQVVQNLTAQNERARAEVEGARRVAENTPIQLDAAKATEAKCGRATKQDSQPLWMSPTPNACWPRRRSKIHWRVCGCGGHYWPSLLPEAIWYRFCRKCVSRVRSLECGWC